MINTRMVRKIPQMMEEQVQRWRAEGNERLSGDSKAFEPAYVITISRASGTFGSEIAREVGRILDIPVYDQEIVEHIASEERVRVETVDTLDERVQNRLDDYVSAIFREKNFDQSDYLTALTHTIMGLWGHGPCIFVGRGANNIISRKYGLSVRLVAPRHYRIRYFKYVEKIDEKTAARRIDRLDAERDAFVRRLYGENINDPNEYDLVLNVTGISGENCSAIIAETFKRKFKL